MYDQITTLFEKMSIRLNNENDLSDITWSMMNTIPLFQTIFLYYCFGRKLNVLEIEREFAVTDSRPDFFFIDNDDKKFIIEVKINDRNMHFNQYNRNQYLSDCEKSFIANYEWKNEKGWHIRTWNGFLESLRNRIASFDHEEQKIIEGYLLYLKNVISYEEIRPMDISGLESIRSFYAMVNEITKSFKTVQFYDYNSSKPCTPEKYGKYVFFEHNKKCIYLWVGLYFTDIAGVYLEFEYNNDFWIPKKYSNILNKLEEGRYFEKPTKNSKNLWIKLKDSYFEKLCNDAIPVADQREIIFNFLDEIIRLLISA